MDLSNKTMKWPQITPLVSVAILDIVLFVGNVAFCCTISFAGVFTNLANIIVFTKMGFSESSNINFFALSAFDLFISLVQLLSKFIYSFFLRGVNSEPVLNVVTSTLTYLMWVAIGGSAMITALISTERCLCVLFPLQVRVNAF